MNITTAKIIIFIILWFWPYICMYNCVCNESNTKSTCNERSGRSENVKLRA